VAQQQLGQPVAGAHEIAAGVLAGAHEIACCLLLEARHAHRDELAQAQQPRQALGISAVGLDLSPEARGIFEGAATMQEICACVQARARPYPVGPAS
jgi:hypothetical protein